MLKSYGVEGHLLAFSELSVPTEEQCVWASLVQTTGGYLSGLGWASGTMTQLSPCSLLLGQCPLKSSLLVPFTFLNWASALPSFLIICPRSAPWPVGSLWWPSLPLSSSLSILWPPNVEKSFPVFDPLRSTSFSLSFSSCSSPVL